MSLFDSTVERVLSKGFFGSAQERDLLREGLMVSYGSDTLKRKLLREFKKYIVEVEDIPFSVDAGVSYKFGRPNTLTLLIQFPKEFRKTELEKLQGILDVCGYFIVKSGFYSQTADLYQFEPKYPVQITKEQLTGYNLFHVAEKDRTENILANGLLPKRSRTEFKHPGNRVYFFATKNSNYLDALKT